jgi:hypothetical protein
MTASHSVLDDPKRWLERAQEAHSIADQLSDPESRRMMLRIAEDLRAARKSRPAPDEPDDAKLRLAGAPARSRRMAPIIVRAPMRIDCRERRGNPSSHHDGGRLDRQR